MATFRTRSGRGQPPGRQPGAGRLGDVSQTLTVRRGIIGPIGILGGAGSLSGCLLEYTRS